MLEIFKKDGVWIATYQGGIMEYDEDLEKLLKVLVRRADEIEKDME